MNGPTSNITSMLKVFFCRGIHGQRISVRADFPATRRAFYAGNKDEARNDGAPSRNLDFINERHCHESPERKRDFAIGAALANQTWERQQPNQGKDWHAV